jgi:predicted RNase H-like nuclease (RuvC/YqgF family)
MGSADVAAIMVGIISVASAIFSGRAARSAAKLSANASVMNSRTQAETEAYQRARAMDIETIERRDKEIKEIRENSERLREKVRRLIQDNQKLHEENERLRRRVTRLEEQLGEMQ